MKLIQYIWEYNIINGYIFAATVTELFDVAQAECSVLFLWTYLGAAFALTVWATIYMWILS